MELVWKIKEGETVKLKDYDPGYTDEHTNREEAEQELAKLTQELGELQEVLYAAHHLSVLVILQGMDTSGKDGTIRHVFGEINPQGCGVTSFKAPTDEELAHDFLWRIHRKAPAKGMIGVFNRSQYEDVLIVRVHNIVPQEVWSQRYKEINQFEKMLTKNGTLIVKFFLHISYEEQERRLLAREQNIDKAWKIDPNDWVERRYWKDYQEAYEDALSKCSTDEAPWYIVPADRKWYRNLAVAHTLVQILKPRKDEWKTELEQRGQKALEALKQLREKA